MIVTKRDGRLEEFNVYKIKEIISFAMRGLDLSPVELESRLQTKFKNKIKTSVIQEELINTALSLSSIEQPDWVIVAGRLEMYSLHSEIYKNTKISYETDLFSIIEKLVRAKHYDDIVLKEYSKEDIDIINTFIKPERDWILPISSVKSLRKKYLLKNKKSIVELPQVANIVTSMFLNINENKENRLQRIKEDYDAISRLKISLATPFKANLRRPNANLSSCFITEIDDNTESITKTLKDIALISKNGGGVGVYLGRLRPSNAYIKEYPGANKITSWTKILNDIISSFNQNGKRAGALTASLDIWHKDILDFIEMRTENGGDIRLKCFDIFPQVVINDKFIKAVIENDDWVLLDRQAVIETLSIDPVDINQFNQNYELIKDKIKQNKIYNSSLIKAKDLWKKILSVYIETGSLYIAHKDNINKTNPFYFDNQFINSVNLCCESFSIARPSYDFKESYNPDKGLVETSFTPGRTHTCNLISLNLSEMKDLEEISKYSRQAVKMLDNAIDLTKVPVIEGELNSKETRVIGVGVMGVADYLANHKLDYIKDKNKVEEIFEELAYNTLEQSVELAKEKGSFLLFDKSCFKQGLFLGKTAKQLQKDSLLKKDWISLLEKAKQGVRNAMLVAVAPNTSTSLLCGCSASYLPVFNKFNYETLSNVNVPVVPKYLKEHFWGYKEVINIPASEIIDLTDRITKWVDTGLSMELTISPEKDNIKDISDSLLKAFQNNLKTVYYCRVLDTAMSKSYCVSCAN